MQIRIINVFTMTLLGMLFLSAGCGKAKPKMTIEEGEEWFRSNKTELLELKELLLEHPTIKRVTPDMSHEFIKNYSKFDREDRIVYDYIEERCKALKIHTISSWRSSKNPELLAITFVIDRQGIAVSGYSISLEYNIDKDLLEAMKNGGDLVKLLDTANWYIIYSES